MAKATVDSFPGSRNPAFRVGESSDLKPREMPPVSRIMGLLLNEYHIVQAELVPWMMKFVTQPRFAFWQVSSYNGYDVEKSLPRGDSVRPNIATCLIRIRTFNYVVSIPQNVSK